MSFIQNYVNFLNRLEEIHILYEEVIEAEFKQRLREVLNWYFVWGHALKDDFPRYYLLYSKEANEQVALAVEKFIEMTHLFCENISIGKDRNNLLEDKNAITFHGNTYDDFIGSFAFPLDDKSPLKDELYLNDDEL